MLAKATSTKLAMH